MKNTYITIVVLVVLVLGALFIFRTGKKVEAPAEDLQSQTSVSADADNVQNNSTGMSTDTSMGVIPEVKEFTVIGKNFSFTPSTITVKEGDKVKITLNNTGGFHDFKIDEFGVATKQAQAPDTEVLEFTANKAGSFEYYCSVGTHRQMGMKGTLMVEAVK